MEEKVGRGCFEESASKARVQAMAVSHWLRCRDGRCLRGDAVYILSLLEPVIEIFPIIDVK